MELLKKIEHTWSDNMCTVCKAVRRPFWNTVSHSYFFVYERRWPSTGEVFWARNEPKCVNERLMRKKRERRILELNL